MNSQFLSCINLIVCALIVIESYVIGSWKQTVFHVSTTLFTYVENVHFSLMTLQYVFKSAFVYRKFP